MNAWNVWKSKGVSASECKHCGKDLGSGAAEWCNWECELEDRNFQLCTKLEVKDKENADLRAEMVAANQQMDKKAEAWQEDFRQVEQERDMYRDSAKTKNSAIDILQADIKKAELRNDRLQKSINHLQFQLGEACLKIAAHEHIPVDKVQLWCDGLRKGYTDLEAQVGVLQSALEVADDTINQLLVIADEFNPDFRKELSQIDQALKLTPTEAGEQIRGLVEALEAIETPSWVEPKELTVFALSQLATEALNKHRGGAANAD